MDDKRSNKTKVTMGDRLLIGGLNLLPKNALSRMVGKVAATPIPKPLRPAVLGSLARMFAIDTAEAQLPLNQYGTFGDLFTRRLKAGARPIETGPGKLICPCDGSIGEYGPIKGGQLMQVKGRSYTMGELLQNEELAETFKTGWFITIYLSPSNYHRVHSPISGEVTHSSYIPGHLWPVNRAGINLVKDLFAVNERIISLIGGEKSKHTGRVCLVMVGATSVGQMTVTHDGLLVSNQKNRGPVPLKEYPDPFPLNSGDEYGVFHLGSTVVLLLERGDFTMTAGEPGEPIQMGELLGQFPEKSDPGQGDSPPPPHSDQ